MTAEAPELFDSHCHLTADRFADDVEAVLQRARATGLVGIVCIASDAGDAVDALDLADRHADVWSTAGVHPHEAARATDTGLQRIRALLDDPRVVAVGETGLDYHYDNSPRDVQRRLLDRHLEWAGETGKPLVVHSREATADTIAVVQAAATAGIRGVLHCFADGDDLLDAALEADWYVSFSGLITFRNYQGAALVRRVPEDRLLIETDAPYLAPVPMRGKRNEPAYVAHTCAALAAMRGCDGPALAAATTRNARRFYALPTAGTG